MIKNCQEKIVFLGTPEFGAIILKGLIKNGYKPVLVYDFEKIEKLKPDLVIVASYGKIIPKEILEIPRYGCLNVHGSLLPKYRGPSPIQTAILNGDKETGITIILMDEKIDHGKIISNSKFLISNKKIAYQELNKKLAELGVKLLIETIPKWINGEIKAKAQDESKATYTKIIKKEDGKIDWKKSAEEIERQIRAFYPWPGTFTFFKKNSPPSLPPSLKLRRTRKLRRTSKILRVKILEAESLDKENPKQLCIKCKKGYLAIKKLQPESKKPMTAEDFLRGYHEYSPLL